jgi:hypothetical protein
MKATDFEWRHPTLIRHGLIAAAVATYLFDPDDVVWRLIKASPDRRALEHGFFFVGTILIGEAWKLPGTINGFLARTTQKEFAGDPSASFFMPWDLLLSCLWRDFFCWFAASWCASFALCGAKMRRRDRDKLRMHDLRKFSRTGKPQNGA